MKKTKTGRGYRTFLLLWLSQSVPVIGNEVIFFTIIIWLTQTVFPASSQQPELTRALSLASLAFALPTLMMAPIAGSLADRYDRRSLMLTANIFGTGIAGMLPLLMLLDRLPFSALLALLGLLSFVTAIHNSAFDTSYFMLVPKEQLPRANGLMQTTWALSGIAAPPLAALLISLPALARQDVFGIPKWLGSLPTGVPIALAFGVVSLLLAALPLPFLPVPSPRHSKAMTGTAAHIMGRDMLAGFKFIRQRQSLLWLLLLFAVANFTSSPLEVFKPVILRFGLAADWTAKGYTFETALALLGTMQGVGALAGGLLVSTWGGLKEKRAYGVIIPLAVSGIVQLIFGISHAFCLAAAMLFLIGATVPVMNAHSQAIWQTQTPPDLQGRVFAARRVIAQFSGPCGTALAGWAGGIFNPGTILAVSGIILAVFAASQYLNQNLLAAGDTVVTALPTSQIKKEI